MKKFTVTTVWVESPDCDRRMAELTLCDRCQWYAAKNDCCNGLCEACRNFYLGECEREFGLDG